MEIKSDRKWHNFKDWAELTDKQKAELDYIKDEYESVLVYRGHPYALCDFMRPDSGLFPGWDGYSSDSFFSGVVIKISGDGDQYQIGTYIS